MSPREPQNALRTKVGSKTLIFQNSSNVSAKINVFEGRRAILSAQICFEEALKRRKKEFEGPESKEREKKDSKELSRELPEAPKGASSHDPPSLPRDYELSRSGSTL